MDTLSFRPAHRQGQKLGDGASQTDRHYIDFIVSGQSLKDLLGRHKLDLIGAFGWMTNKEYENQLVDEFSSKTVPELETGRTCFYVCPECGDIGCGAITAKIISVDNKVIWTEFAHETDQAPPDFTDFKAIRQFEFNKKEYIQAFEKLRIDLKGK